MMPGQPLLRPVPAQVQLLLTERCNLTCLHCAVPAEDSPADHELTTAEWIDIVDGLASAGLRDLTISGGEVFLRSDSLAIARRACIAGIDRVMLVTNATRIDDVARASMIEMQAEHAGLHLHVSLDGGSAATHDWMRGAGNYDRSMLCMARFRSAGGRIDGIQTVVHKGNVHELGAMARVVADLGAHSQTLFPIASVGRGADIAGVSLDRVGWELVLSTAPLLAEAYGFETAVMGPVLGFDWPAAGGQDVPRPRSSRPDRLCLGPDGDAFACPPLREESAGTGRVIAGGTDGVAQVTGRLREQLERECPSCRYLLLCTGVDLDAADRMIPAAQDFRDPTPVRSRPQSVTIGHSG